MYGYTLNTQTHYTMLISTRFDIYLYIYIYIHIISIYILEFLAATPHRVPWLYCYANTMETNILFYFRYHHETRGIDGRNIGGTSSEKELPSTFCLFIFTVGDTTKTHVDIYIYSGNIHIIIYMYLMRPLCLNNVYKYRLRLMAYTAWIPCCVGRLHAIL